MRHAISITSLCLLLACTADDPLAGEATDTADTDPSGGSTDGDTDPAAEPGPQDDPFPEEYPADCIGVPEPEVYRCAEQLFWDVLRTDLDRRRPAYERLTALAEELAATEHRTGLSRLHFQRGQLAMALAIENEGQDLIFEVIPALDQAMALDPDNGIIPTWKDSMEIAFANILQDDVALQEAAARAWEHVELEPMGNILSISGTTIGTALDTGIPQHTIELLDGWVCEGVVWCEDNTWQAPFARPGLGYHFAEAYARVGDVAKAQQYLDEALSAPGADAWPYRHVAEEAAADVEAFAARFAAYGESESPFDIMYANQSFGCQFCHSP
jgi:tetratricopeptide (TPR) repeat protein